MAWVLYLDICRLITIYFFFRFEGNKNSCSRFEIFYHLRPRSQKFFCWKNWWQLQPMQTPNFQRVSTKLYGFLRNQKRLDGKNEKITLDTICICLLCKLWQKIPCLHYNISKYLLSIIKPSVFQFTYFSTIMFSDKAWPTDHRGYYKLIQKSFLVWLQEIKPAYKQMRKSNYKLNVTIPSN